ncbi:MAG: ACP S-malonyltransferase [Armatimonadota bacterium]|nr:ACP S-malonyltransferase [Armatimonadota bacterium]
MGILASKKIALVFPGQGSQEVGMGRSLAENSPAAAALFARADEVLGCGISKLCWEGPEEDLRQTINTQPAIYATSCAALVALYGSTGSSSAIESPLLEEDARRNVLFTAGHSVGEYAALFAAGAFSFEVGLRLVRTRAELMQKAAEEHPGTMAAVLGLSPEQVNEVVRRASDAGTIVAANFNSPMQTVISGEHAAIERASEIAKEMGAKRVVPLNVAGAFHSPLMASAAEDLAHVLQSVEIRDTVVPVVANFTAEAQSLAHQIRENLSKQITGSVRWTESVQRMLDSGVEAFIELGAGNVLAGLIKRIAPAAEVYSVGDKASVDALLSLQG